MKVLAAVVLSLGMTLGVTGNAQATGTYVPVGDYAQPSRTVIVERHVSLTTWHRWRVGRAIAAWDAAPGVHLIRGTCREGVGCIEVRASRTLAPTLIGWAQPWVYEDGSLERFKVWLHVGGGWTQRQRNWASVHELGHGLGLEHGHGWTTMEAWNRPDSPTLPTYADRRTLARLYP